MEDFEFEDDVEIDVDLPIANGVALRDYQIEAIRRVTAGWAQYNRQLLVIATGGGKTVIFCHLAKAIVAGGGKVLILAHTEELCDQAADKLRWTTGIDADTEKADCRASLSADVVIASVQTISRTNRLMGFPQDHFELVIQDEAHRSLAPSFLRVLNYFHFGECSLDDGWIPPEPGFPYKAHANILGVTATADRGDRRSLGEFYQTCSFEYGLLEACRDGYLVRPILKNIPLKIDIRGVRKRGNDYDAGEVAEKLAPIMHAIAEEIARHAADRKTLVFLPSVDAARQLAEAAEDAGLDSMYVSGACPDRAEKVDWFRGAGRGTLLANAMLMTEGVDIPDVSCVCMLRPTKIRSLFVQCLDEETEILTADGWKRDVSVGDLVAAFNRDTEAIEFTQARAVIRREMNGEKWASIRTQSCDIRVTAGHRMVYDHKRRTGWKIKTAEQLAALKDTNLLPAAGFGMQSGVPLSNDEIRFIGWVMTDGTVSKSTRGVTIYQGEHQPMCDEIERVLTSCGMKFTRSAKWRKTQFNQTSRSVRWTISHGQPRATKKHLRGWGALEPWTSKEFAPALMALTPTQFDVLIEAIHLGDGTKCLKANYTRRSYHITTGNRVFADRLQAVALLCGYRCNISPQTGRAGALQIHLKKQRFHRIGGRMGDRPSWRLSDSSPAERCWCVENDLGTLVSRRNGKAIILGNCCGRGTRPLTGTIDGMTTREERIGAIAASSKPNLLLLDFLWLADRLDLVRPVDLVIGRPDMRDKADGITAGNEGEIDLMDLEVLASRDLLKSLEEAARKHANKAARVIDPLSWAISIGDEAMALWEPETAWDTLPATAGQLDFLKKQHIDVTNIKARGYAAKMIVRVLDRLKMKLATALQLDFLHKLGVSESEASQLTIAAATETIDRLLAEKKAKRAAAVTV